MSTPYTNYQLLRTITSALLDLSSEDKQLLEQVKKAQPVVSDDLLARAMRALQDGLRAVPLPSNPRCWVLSGDVLLVKPGNRAIAKGVDTRLWLALCDSVERASYNSCIGSNGGTCAK